MAERSRRSSRERLKYGICLNEECEKCKTKEVIQIPMRKEFVCPVCGRELRECPPPKPKNTKLLIGIIAAVLIIAGAITAICLSGNADGTNEVVPDSIENDSVEAVPEAAPVDSTHVKSDTVILKDEKNNVKVEGTKVIEEHVSTSVTKITTKQSSSTTGTVSKSSGNGNTSLNLSYGKYKGETKGGYPHGSGRLTYTKARQINKYDSKSRMAEAGDYVIGEFVNGFFIQGQHYNSKGELIESLMIGVAADDAYESK